MKLSILFLSLSIITVNCLGQANDDNSFLNNSYNKKNVKDNNIDSICVTFHFSNKKTKRFYAFDKRGNLTYTVTVDETGNKTSESILNYNPHGQLISKKTEEEMVDNNTAYFYNKKGQLERAETKYKAGETIIVTYTYDKQNLIEETRNGNTGKSITKYKYDTQNRLIDLTTLTLQGSDTKGTVAIHKSISYDKRGNKIFEEVSFLTRDTIIYQYNDNNKLVLVRNGKDTEKYFYNNKGMLIRKEFTRFLTHRPMTYSEKYRYVVRK